MIGTAAGPSVRDAMAHLLPSLANLSLRPTSRPDDDDDDDPEDMPASATGVIPGGDYNSIKARTTDNLMALDEYDLLMALCMRGLLTVDKIVSRNIPGANEYSCSFPSLTDRNYPTILWQTALPDLSVMLGSPRWNYGDREVLDTFYMPGPARYPVTSEDALEYARTLLRARLNARWQEGALGKRRWYVEMKFVKRATQFYVENLAKMTAVFRTPAFKNRLKDAIEEQERARRKREMQARNEHEERERQQAEAARKRQREAEEERERKRRAEEAAQRQARAAAERAREERRKAMREEWEARMAAAIEQGRELSEEDLAWFETNRGDLDDLDGAAAAPGGDARARATSLLVAHAERFYEQRYNPSQKRRRMPIEAKRTELKTYRLARLLVYLQRVVEECIDDVIQLFTARDLVTFRDCDRVTGTSVRVVSLPGGIPAIIRATTQPAKQASTEEAAVVFTIRIPKKSPGGFAATKAELQFYRDAARQGLTAAAYAQNSHVSSENSIRAMLNGLWTNYWEPAIQKKQAGAAAAAAAASAPASDALRDWAPADPTDIPATERFGAACTTPEEPQANPETAADGE